MGVVPHYVRWREAEAEHYFDEWCRCVSCDINTRGGRGVPAAIAKPGLILRPASIYMTLQRHGAPTSLDAPDCRIGLQLNG
jgi:hypothetical protein